MSERTTRGALATIADGLHQLLSVRWVRAALVLCVLALLARASLELVMTRVIDRVARERELVVHWEDLDLSLLRGKGSVRFLEVTPRDGAEPPLVQVDYAVFDLEVLALLTGELRIRRAEVDGLEARLERDADGNWNLERHVDVAEVLALLETSQDEPEVTSAEPRPIVLAPPLAVEALRMQDARLRLVDASVEPAVDLVLAANLGLSNVLTSDRPARFAATLTGGRALDGAHVEGSVAWTETGLALDLWAQAGGLRPRELASWLAPLDIRPACDSLGGTLRARVDVDVIGEQRDGLRASVAITDAALSVDSAESFALDGLVLEVDSISSAGAAVPRIELHGVRANASIEANGALRIAGLELATSTEAEEAAHWLDSLMGALELWTSTDTPRWATLLLRSDPDAYPWSLGSLAVTDGAVRFTDWRVDPAASFPLTITSINVGAILHDPTRTADAIPIEAELRAPGMADTISINGSIGPFAPTRSLDLTVALDGIGLESLEGYLRGAGLERKLQRGSMNMRLVGNATTDDSGRTEGWIELEEIKLEEAGELFGVRSVTAHELVFDPAEGRMQLGNVEIAGPRLAFARDPSNQFVAFGLRTLGLAPGGGLGGEPEESGSDGARAAPEDENQPALPSLTLEIGRFAWTDSDVVFVDELADPPTELTFDELGFELTGLTLGGDPDSPPMEPARFTARAVAENLFDELTVEGSIRSRPGTIDLTGDLAVRGSGARGRLAAPYLRAFGIEPAIEDGRLAVDLTASVRREEAGAGGWTAGLELRDASLTDLGVTIASVQELRVEDLRVGDELAVGAIEVVAPFIRLAREPGGQILVGGVRILAGAAPVEDVPPPQLSYPRLPAFLLERLEVVDARVGWTDAGFEPAIETELIASVSGEGLGTSGSGRFELELTVPETIDVFIVRGEAELGEQRAHVTASFEGSGIGPGPLSRMLPPGFQLESASGRLQGSVEASVSNAVAGGLAANLAAEGLTWGGDEGAPWLAVESAELACARLDPSAGVYALEARARVSHVAARRDGEGALHALGLSVRPPPPATVDDDEAAPAELPVLGRIELTGPASLEVEHFVYEDALQGPGARPVEGAARFSIEGPQVLMDATPQELAALVLAAEGSIAGLVGSWRAALQVAPFAVEPRFEAELEASGVRTAGLIEMLPALGVQLTGAVEDGHFHGRAEGTLFVRRGRPTELGITRPFGAELKVADVTWRASEGGEVLAGVDSVTAEIERVDTELGRVHVKTVEIERPQGIVRREGMELSLLGFDVALLAPPEVAGTPVEASAPAPTPPAAGAAAAPGDAPGDAEFRLDRLMVTGIDFHVRDDSVTPPLAIALADLDAEVKGLTTRALEERRPIHFSVLLEGDRVFEEVAVSGRVALAPELDGWVQLTLAGVELTSFAGVADEQGFALEDGALDMSASLRLKGSKGGRVHSALVFSDLEVTEKPGGPIESALALPVPLDSALFFLRNADGEHRFSFGFAVDESGLSRSQMVLAGTQAFTGVLAGALVGAPFRLLGLGGGGEDEGRVRETKTLDFGPAGTELGGGDVELLLAIRAELGQQERLRAVVSHELTAADLARAEQFANPTQAECLEIAAGLRQRKAELWRLRGELATEARALYAVGAEEAGEATARLRATDADLADVEHSLDRVLEILRSDSPRQRAKRTRAACREIAELRLAAATAVLLAGLPEDVLERVEVRSARFDPIEDAGGGRVLLELRER